jgi:hypothetical protein
MMRSRRWLRLSGVVAGAVGATALVAVSAAPAPQVVSRSAEPARVVEAPEIRPTGLRDDTPVILNEYNGVSSTRWLDCDQGPPVCDAEDTFFGRVRGNGGDWFELVVTMDHVDMRGWQLAWEDDNLVGTGTVGTLTLTDDPLWSDLRAGTLITFSESDTARGGLDTDTNFDPSLGDWWIHVNTLVNEDDIRCVGGTRNALVCDPNVDPEDPFLGCPGGGVCTSFEIPQEQYVTTVTTSGSGPGHFTVSNDDWQLTILDETLAVVFGPAGEVIAGQGVNSREVFKLEEDPSPQIDPITSGYNDGVSSTFGAPNLWGDGDRSQDFSGLRAPGTSVVLVAVPSFDPNSAFEDHSTFPNLDEVTTLPTSLTTFTAGQVFYVEMWAQTLHATGLSMLSADIHFDALGLNVVGGNGFPASGVFHTTLFNALPSGTVLNPTGLIDDLSGSYLPTGGCAGIPTGEDPRWSRVAVVKMQAAANGSPFILCGPSASSIYVVAHCGTPEIDPDLILYQGINAPTGSLTLTVPTPPQTVMQGELATVDLVAGDVSLPINGVQALIRYNPGNLALLEIDPVPPWVEISQTVVDGEVAYGAYIEGGTVGPGVGPYPVATLTFVALDPGTPVVRFLADDPDAYPEGLTKLTTPVPGVPAATILPTTTDSVDGDIVIEPCEDGDPCTLNTFNVVSRQCEYPPAAAGTPCGDPTSTDCDRPDTCDGAGVCQGNLEPAGTSCTDDTPGDCDDAQCDGTGVCDQLYGVELAGYICRTANLGGCDAVETCDGALGGACPADVGLPDGTVCRLALDADCDTPETCDGSTDPCPVEGGHVADGTPCTDDGNECTDDVCGSGWCTHPGIAAGTPCGDPTDTVCTDPDTCLAGVCEPNHALNGTPCDDGLFCNVDESCTDGVCGGGTANPCDDSDPCTADACDEDEDVCFTTDGDWDGDGVVDVDDYPGVESCLTGPDGSYPQPECCRVDRDLDGDVDLIDVADWTVLF